MYELYDLYYKARRFINVTGQTEWSGGAPESFRLSRLSFPPRWLSYSPSFCHSRPGDCHIPIPPSVIPTRGCRARNPGSLAVDSHRSGQQNRPM